MGITYQEVLDADSEMASRYDKPTRFGLQTLTAEEQDMLLDFLDATYERAMHVNYHATSEVIARNANRYFKEKGVKLKITNLMVKSAMLLLGFEPSVPSVDIQNYRVRFRK